MKKGENFEHKEMQTKARHHLMPNKVAKTEKFNKMHFCEAMGSRHTPHPQCEDELVHLQKADWTQPSKITRCKLGMVAHAYNLGA
jgi:hypothetical protein